MQVITRLLGVADAAAYRALRLKSFQDTPYAFSESFEDEKRRSVEDFGKELSLRAYPPEQFVLGAFIKKNQLIGFVRFQRDLRSKARHKSRLHAMYVDADFRNLGIGERIAEDLFQRVQLLRDLEQIHLSVLHAEGMPSAVDFYSRLGFKRQGALIKNDLKIGNTYIDTEYMVRYL